ncbi:hypothetical protein OHS33_39170 (plasmid) [Streptomyces sp. NBC_00536]|uniref:hypothetical protein n=1 Tax=Streptomyces sp. NBC_00536 TaxID=2975769 RepID=UPI002E810A8C|nr:hypothetical protein [Streptomyces sp. NBC_00536]WUC84381.1 hypothetical protein OHS33_39170 [Streptomyces sp. NBC_00536]
MSAAATRRTRRRAAAAVLRTRRADNRAQHLAATRVKVSDFLTSVGADEEFIDRFGSWAGRHIAAAHRAANHGYDTPLRAWKRTKPCKNAPKGRWIKVNVYWATDPALIAGALQYKRTAPFVTAAYAVAA